LIGEPRSIKRDLLVLTLLIGGAFLLFLGYRALSVPDEGRYVEIPREMVATGDWLTPRLNGVKYFEKPALFYWLQAIALELGGRSEFVLRLWPALFGLGGCLSVYIAGRELWGRRPGWLAAGTMATSLLYFELSRFIIIDMAVTFFLTVTFVSFLVGVRAPPGRTRDRLMYLMYAAAAAATLTKGLIGIVLPGMVVFTWMLLANRWVELRRVELFTGILLFLFLAAPWHIAVGDKNPEFSWFYFVHEHYLRFTSDEHGRGQPVWFFLAIIFVGWLPWSTFLPSAIFDAVRVWWRDREAGEGELYVFLWFLLPFLFFSASHSKLIPYALPFFPPLALLLGRWLDQMMERRTDTMIICAAALGLICVLLGIVTAVVGHWPQTYLSSRRADDVALVADLLPGLALGFIAVAVMVSGTAGRGAAGALTIVLLVSGLALGLTVDRIAGAVQPRSVKGLAHLLQPRLEPGDEVVSFRAYYQDLPFYLDRRVTVADWSGELDFGRSVEDDSVWMIDEAEFWRRWSGDRAMYAIMGANHFATLSADPGHKLFEIAHTRADVLVTNRPPG
jgi:4-amino-4-deoxy-L-arabinose transferase-like glycosyltransferase